MMRLKSYATILLVLLAISQPVRAGIDGLLSKVPLADRVRLEALDRGMSAKAYNTVYFDFDQDLLDGEARARIRQQAAFIRSQGDVKFAVTGHTDKVGNSRYNMNLGLRRASRVVNELVRLGVRRDQLVVLVSMGEEDPAIDVETRERRNRRVTTRVLMPKDLPEVRTPPPGDRAGATPAGGSPTPTGGDPVDEPVSTTTTKPRPGNSAEGTGRPDAGAGNGNEPSGDPEGSIGHNRGGDEVDGY